MDCGPRDWKAEKMFYVNKIALMIANPMTVGVVLAVVGLVLVSSFMTQICSFKGGANWVERRQKVGWWLLVMASLWFGIWGMGITQHIMGWAFGLDDFPVVEIDAVPSADYIVDLGGGISINTNVCSRPCLYGAADRVLMSARLWKAKKAPFVVPTTAGVERTNVALLKECGVPEEAILVENQARNTEENAIFVQRLLRDRHLNIRTGEKEGRAALRPKIKVLLVTSASHMRRAMMIFKKKAPDIECVPVVADHGSVNFYSPLTLEDFIPHVGTLAGNMIVYKECLGVFGYKMRGY